jgi:hypothetical protein
MINFNPISLPGLVPVPAVVSGDWMAHPTKGYRDWRGQVTSERPVVGLALLARGESVDWVKSPRQMVGGVEVRLMLGPYDSHFRDVQVSVGIGYSGTGSRMTVPSAEYRPAIETGPCKAGQFTLVSRVEGDQRLEFWILLVAKSDIRGSRNGLWRVRDNVVAGIGAPWNRVLTYGRTGIVTV